MRKYFTDVKYIMFTFVIIDLYMEFTKLYTLYREKSLTGRYVYNDSISVLIDSLSTRFSVVELGHSVLGKKITGCYYGTGKTKILMWSQMHGNEATTTKALFDFISFLESDSDFALAIKKEFTLFMIPILNPDGAAAYTRTNANEVDLNRDSVALTQPESIILRKQIDTFKPDLCLNLHDQRTIFGTKGYKLPATVSFLAPSFNESRDINEVRTHAMQLIACMYEDLSQYIPNQIGRFDDGFNLNCIGDMCTNLNIPTILFEAGHFSDDYQREETRKYIFYSYLSLFNALLSKSYVNKKIEDYLRIPENTKSFFDILYKNFQINVGDLKKSFNFAVQFEENLIEKDIKFVAKIAQIDNLENHFGHIEFDMNGIEIQDSLMNMIKIGELANYELPNGAKIVNGLLIK